MSETIIVHNFETKEKIGSVALDEQRKLVITGETEDLKKKLEEFMAEITKKSLPYRSGRTDEQGRNISLMKMCTNKDEEFLRALRDNFSWRRNEELSLKIFGYRLLGSMEENNA